jgi:hypothetical protein
VAQHGAGQSVVDVRDRPDELDRLADRLVPGRNRADVLRCLDAVFVSGVAPAPPPSGFQSGRLLATSTWAPWDAVVMGIAQLWMPWLGKSFSASTGTGLNHFLPTGVTLVLLRILFPRHAPEQVLSNRILAFPFRTRVAPGELDPKVDVLKIDYDFEANPGLIRHILDELVQIAPGRYLGKVLFRLRGRFHRIGYFSLEAGSATRS